MSVFQCHLVGMLAVGLCLGLIACGDGEVENQVTEAAHDAVCEAVFGAIPGGEGSGIPGVAGAGRWGLGRGLGDGLSVRRSWSTLSSAEKQQVVDAFLALKKTTVDSGLPGAERADYASHCGNYDRNLYDFYVELHASAFVSMDTTDMDHYQMAHMGPQFLPWHRYLLLRLEADLRTVSGDPSFALPYWDWQDCYDDPETCPLMFEPEYLGSAGSCSDDTDATGYLADSGFEKHLWTTATENVFSVDSITCSTAPLQRQVGCSDIGEGLPPSLDDVHALDSRTVYDAEPYTSCGTDETVSMRQYLEGFTLADVNPLCVAGGCQMHGQGHYYVGGDMASGGGTINDPIFFLHHANVDRLWAMWQDARRQDGVVEGGASPDYGNPGFPDAWRGALFNFTEVRADELFDFRSLGFTYDTAESRSIGDG